MDPEVAGVLDSWDTALVSAYAHYAKQVRSGWVGCAVLGSAVLPAPSAAVFLGSRGTGSPPRCSFPGTLSPICALGQA